MGYAEIIAEARKTAGSADATAAVAALDHAAAELGKLTDTREQHEGLVALAELADTMSETPPRDAMLCNEAGYYRVRAVQVERNDSRFMLLHVADMRFKQACELAPDQSLYRMNRGWLALTRFVVNGFLDLPALDAAQRHLNVASQLDGADWRCELNMGYASLLRFLMQRGNTGLLRDAERVIEAVAKQHPVAEWYVALLAAARGNFDRALTVLEACRDAGTLPARWRVESDPCLARLRCNHRFQALFPAVNDATDGPTCS